MGDLGWLARDGVFMPRDGSRRRDPGSDSRVGQDDGHGRIRCPCCGWAPGRHDRWACTCLHLWNTFETGGVCPACGRQWAETQCPRCNSWSPHLDWYATPSPPSAPAG
jgi:hypothetical protein